MGQPGEAIMTEYKLDYQTVNIPVGVAEGIDKILLYLEAEMKTTPYEQEYVAFDAAILVRSWLNSVAAGA
jgi:hypothetical protein